MQSYYDNDGKRDGPERLDELVDDDVRRVERNTNAYWASHDNSDFHPSLNSLLVYLLFKLI